MDTQAQEAQAAPVSHQHAYQVTHKWQAWPVNSLYITELHVCFAYFLFISKQSLYNIDMYLKLNISATCLYNFHSNQNKVKI